MRLIPALIAAAFFAAAPAYAQSIAIYEFKPHYKVVAKSGLKSSFLIFPKECVDLTDAPDSNVLSLRVMMGFPCAAPVNAALASNRQLFNEYRRKEARGVYGRGRIVGN